MQMFALHACAHLAYAAINALLDVMFGAWQGPIRSGFVYMACPDPSEVVGRLVAPNLVKKMAESGDLAETDPKIASWFHFA